MSTYPLGERGEDTLREAMSQLVGILAETRSQAGVGRVVVSEGVGLNARFGSEGVGAMHVGPAMTLEPLTSAQSCRERILCEG